jgi:hypothetical protein
MLLIIMKKKRGTKMVPFHSSLESWKRAAGSTNPKPSPTSDFLYSSQLIS